MMDFINDLFRVGRIELLRLRLNLIYAIILTFVGVLPILILKPAVGVCFCITVVPWLVTAYCLFSITRYIHMHIAGEAFEFIDETSDAISRRLNKEPAGRRYRTGILDNPFIRVYRRVISGIFFLQTALFLMLPLYVNYTEGGLTTGIIIAMLATVVFIGSVTLFTKLFRVAITLTVIAYSVGLLFVLIPQLGVYTHSATSSVNIMPTSTAKLNNEISDNEAKRQEREDNEFLQGVIAYQKKHPDEELPQKYKDRIERGNKLVK